MIIMPDGKQIESISPEEPCLCGNTQNEILGWIVDNIPGIQIDEKIEIEYTPVGYYVLIHKAR